MSLKTSKRKIPQDLCLKGSRWYTIRGSNDVARVRNVEKWRFIRTARSDLPKNLPKSLPVLNIQTQ